MFASLIVHSLVHSWALPPARISPGISVFRAGERNPLSRGYTSDVLLAMLMRFFGKLSSRQRAVKIACVATLAQVMPQMEKSQKKIAKNSNKIAVFVRGWLHFRFSPRAGDATIFKKLHHHRKQKIARVAAALSKATKTTSHKFNPLPAYYFPNVSRYIFASFAV